VNFEYLSLPYHNPKVAVGIYNVSPQGQKLNATMWARNAFHFNDMMTVRSHMGLFGRKEMEWQVFIYSYIYHISQHYAVHDFF
jgi:hypothetical protein